MTEFVSKVGTRGEIYIPKKYREKMGIKPNSEIRFTLFVNGLIKMTPIQTLSEILQSTRERTKINPQDMEKHSEEMQKRLSGD